MRQEVLDFYKSNRIPVDRMVHVGVRRRGLTADSIRKAAEEVYDGIRDGKINVKPIQIAWEVYGRSIQASAPTSPAAVYDALLRVEQKLDDYMTPWYVKFWRKFNGKQGS